MPIQKPTDSQVEIDSLLTTLESNDPAARQRARESLVTLHSREVTAALVLELIDPRAHVRWEAAKALSDLADPVAAPALVDALEDEDQDVRWLAAEGLVALGKTGLMAVLNGLIKRAGSTAFCRSAHHVLHGCSQEGNEKAISPVLVALIGPDPGICVPPAAYDALIGLKIGHGVES